MRFFVSGIIVPILGLAVAALAEPQHDHAGHGAEAPTNQATSTQPAQPKVVVPQGGRQVFKSTHASPPPAKATPAPPVGTVVLKPGEVPGIKFDTPVYDFGRVRAGTEINHDFWFTNTGNGPLEILAVRPG